VTELEKTTGDKISCSEVSSVDEFLKQVSDDSKEWKCEGNVIPWFRGQDNCLQDPIPKLFRSLSNKNKPFYSEQDEFDLVTTFRNRAPALKETPDRDRLNEWLFFMQHFGMPTRLLDWTESSLIALFFAAYEIPRKKEENKTDPAVWMIHPIELNKMTRYLDAKQDHKYSIETAYQYMMLEEDRQLPLNQLIKIEEKGRPITFFPNTWSPKKIGIVNFQYAFAAPETRKEKPIATKYPIAVQPTYVHLRMFAQKSVFTIHGYKTIGFERLFYESSLVRNGYLKKYVISRDNVSNVLNDLKSAGITYSTLFPDYEGLSKELIERFTPF